MLFDEMMLKERICFSTSKKHTIRIPKKSIQCLSRKKQMQYAYNNELKQALTKCMKQHLRELNGTND